MKSAERIFTYYYLIKIFVRFYNHLKQQSTSEQICAHFLTTDFPCIPVSPKMS